jgi:hypothetical protein
MNSTLKRFAALAAIGTVGVLAPVASASAATTPVAPAAFALPALPSLPTLPLTGFPTAGLGLGAFNPAGLSFVGPSVGAIASVIGPTVITTAPSTFVNTNIQTSAGSNLSGGQG